jgi:sulfur carrier protein ThiS
MIVLGLSPAADADPETKMTQAIEHEDDGALSQSNTIRITLKLFALLSGYLPDGATRNQVDLSVPASSTPMSIMSLLHLPAPLCALVVINGTFVHMADRATRRLVDGDVLAIWPPIAGG